MNALCFGSKTMQKVLIAFIVGFLTAGQAAASEKAAVMATVHQIVDGFNKGDTQSLLSTCASETSIIDEVPPHEWHGAGGCSAWMKDYGIYAQKEEIADAVTTLGVPRRIQISVSNAYVVIPAKCDYKQKGKPVHENVIVTLSLHKSDSQWRLTGWTWARL
jgi:hypothetical protein